MMTRDHSQEDLTTAGLDDLFAELRAVPTEVPDRLMARVMADAARLQPSLIPVGAAAPRPAPRGWLALLAGLFGGGASVAGLVAAGAAGIWIGFAQPFELGFDLQASTLDSLDFFPADLDQWSEALAPDLLADD